MWRCLIICCMLVGNTIQMPQKSAAVLFEKDVSLGLCEIPTVLWKPDGKCYNINERGPCGEGQVIVFSKTERAAICIPDTAEQENGAANTPDTRSAGDEDSAAAVVTAGQEDSAAPAVVDSSRLEAECENNFTVYWPATQECHQLLSQGPCQEGEWLVLDSTAPLRARCEVFLCGPNELYWPELCECINRNSTERVLKLCGEHSSLLPTPYGEGICGCEYGFESDNDGVCQELGTQGSCEEGEVWRDEDGEVGCFPPAQRLKVRVFDLVYQNPAGSAQTVRCYQDSKGRCRAPVGYDTPRISASEFEVWASSFSKRAKSCEEREEKCEGDTVLYTDGKCYQLASTGPCDAGEWLVLDSVVGERLVLGCKVRPCLEGGAWWTGSCSCVGHVATVKSGNTKKNSSVCGENEELFVSPYGRGICGCREGFTLESGDCEKSQDNSGEAVVFELKEDDTHQATAGLQLATPQNCREIINGKCGQQSVKGKSEGSVGDLIAWLEQFPSDSQHCA